MNRSTNRAITRAQRQKPYRNWKLTGNAFYDRPRSTRVLEEAIPEPTLDADAINRRIKYGY